MALCELVISRTPLVAVYCLDGDRIQIIQLLHSSQQWLAVTLNDVSNEKSVGKRKIRVVKIQNANTDLKIDYCLDPHDLAAFKLAAGRDKDRPFVASMLEHQLTDVKTLRLRVDKLPISSEHKHRLQLWLSQH